MLRCLVPSAVALMLGAGLVNAGVVHPVPDEGRRISITAPEMAGADQIAVQHTGFWHREDYARFRSGRYEAEIIYAAADPHENAALEIPLTFARARDSFAINQTDARRLGAVGRIDAPGRTIFYQPYSLTDRGWSCVALKSEWNHVGRDPRNRPARLVFGYICDQSGAAMTTARAETLAGSVKTTGDSVSWSGNGPVLGDLSAIGNTRFPFGFGVHFNDHDSDPRSN